MTKFCSKCGNQIVNSETDFFCSSCGACLKKIIKNEEPRNQVGPSTAIATAKSPRLTPKIQEIANYAQKTLADAPEAKVVIQIVDKCGSCSNSPMLTTKDRSVSLPHNGSPRPLNGKPRSVSSGHMSKENVCGHEGVVKQGWLNKQSNILSGWKRRWFKLHRGLLLYFDRQEDDKARGSMPVSSCFVEVLDHQKPNCFRVTVGYLKDGKTHTMQADNSEDMESWVETLVDRGAKMYDPKMLEWNADASARLLTGVADAASDGPSTSPTASPSVHNRHKSSPTPSNKQHQLLTESTRSKSGTSLSSIFKKITESPKMERIITNPIKGSRSAESIFTNPFASKESSSPQPEAVHVIGSPVLITKPNPVQLGFPVLPIGKTGSAPVISAVPVLPTSKVASAPSTPATRSKPPPPPPRELLFSPSPKTRAVKKGNEFTCEVCGYKSGSFLNFCGSCGSRLERVIV